MTNRCTWVSRSSKVSMVVVPEVDTRHFYTATLIHHERCYSGGRIS